MNASLPKTMLVTPQLPRVAGLGGIGSFTLYFAQVLKQAGFPVRIMVTSPLLAPTATWKPFYDQLGLEVTPIYEAMPEVQSKGYNHTLLRSQTVQDYLPADIDLIYFADWQANGLVPVRQRRYQPPSRQKMITVLHGCTEWDRQGKQWWTSNPDDLITDFTERYVAQHSDWVISPSRYLIQWARQNSWKLPPESQLAVLGYPFLPPATRPLTPYAQEKKFRRIIFFGRADTRKGIDLFIEALNTLKGESVLQSVEEIVILGNEGAHKYHNLAAVLEQLAQHVGIQVTHLANLNTHQAQDYLYERRNDSLVVVPSRVDNFPFTVIELSLIQGLNFITSNIGGIPEILNNPAANHFDPTIKHLAKMLRNCLEAGLQPAYTLPAYDWQGANQRWLDFHQNLCDQVKTKVLPKRPKPTDHVDICIPHHNLGQYLPQLLQSLDQQTTDRFNVYLVDDGSDEAHRAIFRAMQQHYQKPNWYFVEKENEGVSATRNFAAALGGNPYLLFVDADNVATPQMVEKFLESISYSGDDCLTSYMYVFKSDLPPTWSNVLLPAHHFYTPIGNNLTLNLLVNAFGDGNCILRREAFEAIGGFTLDIPYDKNHEDQELLTRLALEGYQLDVIPEFLFYYRYREDSRHRNTTIYEGESRVSRHYEEKLADLALDDLIPLILGLKYTATLSTRRFVNPDGTTFPDLMSYLTDGVQWQHLATALRQKVVKNLRQTSLWKRLKR